MEATPSLMGIPIELRFKIIKYVAGNYRKRPQILPQEYFHPMDGGWLDQANPWDKPSGLQDVISLSKANRCLHREVAASFWPKVDAHFHTTPETYAYNDSPHDAPYGMRGLYTLFCSVYHAFSSENTDLRFVCRTLTSISLKLVMHPSTVEVTTDLVSMIYYRLPVVDENRWLVEIINASPTMRKLSLCGTCETQPGPPKRTQDARPIFAPFMRLKASVKLHIHLHLVEVWGAGSRTQEAERIEIPILTDGQHSQEGLDYLEELQQQHHLDPEWDKLPSLHDEWIRFRAILINTLPELRTSAKEPWMGGRAAVSACHYSVFRAVDSTYRKEFATAIMKVWNAYDIKDRAAFDAGREEITKLWDVQSRQRSRILRQGFVGIEGGEDDRAALGENCRVGLYDNVIAWRNAKCFESWSELVHAWENQ